MDFTLGTDEKSPGWFPGGIIPGTRQTAFDQATTSLIAWLKSDLSLTQWWDYIGLNGGPVRDFLNAYMDTATQLGRPYDQNDLGNWRAGLAQHGIDQVHADKYLQAIRTLYAQGRISDLIYNPANAKQAGDLGAVNDTTVGFGDLSTLALAALAIYVGVGIAFPKIMASKSARK